MYTNFKKELKGQKLISITFIHDYMQISFDVNGLTLNNLPIVTNKDKTFRYDNKNYKNEICDLIGENIVDISINEEICQIRFGNSKLLTISLIPDGQYPEALICHYYNGKNDIIFN